MSMVNVQIYPHFIKFVDVFYRFKTLLIISNVRLLSSTFLRKELHLIASFKKRISELFQYTNKILSQILPANVSKSSREIPRDECSIISYIPFL